MSDNIQDLHINIKERIIKAVNEIAGSKYNLEYKDLADQPLYTGPIMHIQYAINNNLKKVYLYIDLDENFKFGRADKAVEFYNFLIKELVQKFKMYIGYSLGFLGPIGKCKVPSQYITNQTSIITPYTITYWKSIDGLYEFIDDKEERTRIMNNKLAETGIQNMGWLSLLRRKIAEINKEYEYFKNMDNNDVTEGFEKLKIAYKQHTGQDIEKIDEADIYNINLAPIERRN